MVHISQIFHFNRVRINEVLLQRKPLVIDISKKLSVVQVTKLKVTLITNTCQVSPFFCNKCNKQPPPMPEGGV